MANLFSTGLSGLVVSQRALATTGHNIANANTEGYSRQRVEIGTRLPQRVGPGFVGSGVETTGVRRVYDQFLVNQIRTGTSSAARTDTFHELAARVDNLLADPSTSLSSSVQDFFASVQALTTDPASIPARQVVVSEANVLAQRLASLDLQIEQQRAAVSDRLESLVAEVNGLASGIAGINQQILDTEVGTGAPANDLRDRRDELLRQLSERVDVTAYAQDDGAINVAIGSGQSLVLGSTSSSLALVPNGFDPAREEIALVSGGGSSVISDLIGGGELAGVLDFRASVLDGAQNAIGRVAVGLASEFNARHALGVDLDGQRGGAFFTDLRTQAPQTLEHTANTGDASLAVAIRDPGQLTASDYELARSGASYTLTRLSDGASFALAGFPGGSEVVDGLDLSVASGTIADGDRFVIRPTREAARRTDVLVASPRDVAAASPVSGAAALANTGTATMSAPAPSAPDHALRLTFDTPPSTFDVVDATTGATLAEDVAYAAGAPVAFNGLAFSVSGAPAAGDVFAIDHRVASADAANAGTGTIAQPAAASADPNLADPVTLTFDSPPSTFTVTGATTGSPTAGVPYTSGEPVSFNGWTVTISGDPAAGDQFTVAANATGVGDNRNALALAELHTADTLVGRGTSFEGAYGQFVTEIGTLTRAAEIEGTAQRDVLGQLESTRESVSGVNLDEEAADLLRFQQAYQASARMISVADELFVSLMQAVGG